MYINILNLDTCPKLSSMSMNDDLEIQQLMVLEPIISLRKNIYDLMMLSFNRSTYFPFF